MAKLAESIVEEWLNRQGFFTIHGIKFGNHEIDVLAGKKHFTGGAGGDLAEIVDYYERTKHPA